MGVSIPLGGTNGGPVTIPIGIGATNTSPSNRESALLRAVAGGATIRAPQAARVAAKNAKDNPAAVPAILAADTARLAPVLTAIDRAMSNRAGAAAPGPQETAVARAIGADAVLVKAALDALPAAAADAINVSAIAWVAGTEPQLLEAGGRAATRQAGLAALPAPSARLDQVEAAIAALTAALAALPPPGAGPVGPAGPPGAVGPAGPPADPVAILQAMQQLMQDLVQPLRDRIGALEAKVP